MTIEAEAGREPEATKRSLARLLVFLFGVSIPLTNVTRFYLGGTGSAAELVLLGIAAVAVVTVMKNGLVVTRAIVLMAAFVLLSLVAWFWHGAANLGIGEQVHPEGVIRALEYFTAFLAIVVLARDARIRTALVAGLWTGCAIAVLFALGQWRLGPGAAWFWSWGPPWANLYAETGEFRVWGSMGNPLELVTYLAPFLGFAAVLARTRGGGTQRFYLSMLVLLPLAMLVTGSKSALLIVALALVVVLRSGRSVSLLPTVVTLAVVAGVIWLSGATAVIQDRAAGGLWASESSTQRGYVIRAAFRVIADHPLLGVGPDNFSDVYGESYWVTGASREESTFSPENFLLMTAGEAGVPAALCLAALVLLGILAGFRGHREGAEGLSLSGRTLSVRIICYALMSMIQPATAVATNLLLFSLLGLQEAIRVGAPRPRPVTSSPTEGAFGSALSQA